MARRSITKKHSSCLFPSPTLFGKTSRDDTSSSSSLSTAEKLRTKGNHLFTLLQNGNFSTFEMITLNVLQAKEYYLEALEASSTSDERSLIYTHLGSIYFLWIKLEMGANHDDDDLRANEAILSSCNQWIITAVDYYFKALLLGGEALMRKKLLFDIVYWAATSSEKHPSLLEVVCKAIDEKPPCKVASQAYLIVVDLMIKRVVVLLEEYKESNASMDCIDRLQSWKDACEQPLERLQSLAHFLQIPNDVLMSRNDLFQLLLDFIPPKVASSSSSSSCTTHSIDHSFSTVLQVVLSRVANAHLSYSQAFDDGLEERAATYKDNATLFFLWAKCKLWDSRITEDEETLESCKQWAKKALQYYYKAISEGQGGVNKLLLDIVDWAAYDYSSSCSPTLLKLVCKAIEAEGAHLLPSSNAYIQHLVACSYSSLKLVDGMLFEGIALLEEYMERFDGEGVMMDYSGSLLMMECQKALERLTTLNGSLLKPHDLMLRNHLLHLLLNRFHFNKNHEAMETLGATLHPPALMDDGLEELGSTYKGIGTIFFLWAKHEETSESCKQLASKAVQYYYKAMLKGESGANKLLLDIVNWATQTDASSKKNPSLMKLICKAMDEKAPCKAASQASLLLLDFIINQGAPLFGKCKKRNTIVCFQDDLHSWKNDCEERFKRLQSLAVFLQMPQVLMSRQDLFQLLIDFIPSKFTTHSFYKSFHTDFHVVLSRVASVNLSYSQALDEASEEEPTSTYKDIATLFFLWAKCKLSEIGSTKDEKLLRHCKQWAKKSLQYYYKAMWEGELETQLLFTIVDWAAHIYSSSSSPTLLKLVCKAIEDEGAYLVPSSNTYIQHLVASSYSYLKLVDGMLYEGITLLKEYMERFGGEGVMMDYGGSLLMMKECQKALERLTTLNGSLQQPHDLIGRLHLMHFLLNTLHFNKKDEAMETLATLMDNNQQIETLGATLNPRAMKTIVTLTREHQVRVLEEKRKREENERKILMKLKEKRMREEEEARREILLKLEEKRRLEEKVEREILINIEERKGILKMEAHKSAESYLRFLYKEYPHPNPNKKLESISNPMETREALRMAIHHYHPDTNIKHGREWVSFCNEVTKFLNNKYMNYTDELL